MYDGGVAAPLLSVRERFGSLWFTSFCGRMSWMRDVIFMIPTRLLLFSLLFVPFVFPSRQALH